MMVDQRVANAKRLSESGHAAICIVEVHARQDCSQINVMAGT